MNFYCTIFMNSIYLPSSFFVDYLTSDYDSTTFSAQSGFLVKTLARLLEKVQIECFE